MVVDKVMWLSRYGELADKMKWLAKQIKGCEAIASSASTLKFDHVVGKSNRSTEAPFEQWIIRKVDYEKQLEELKPQAEKVMQETTDAISRVCDYELEAVLVNRYVHCLSWAKIGSLIYLSSTQVRRLHDKAIEKFQVPNEKRQGTAR
jgi:DNA-directed RNA polymerase specialized sigma subunit